MKGIPRLILISAFAAFSVWLFSEERAAIPGPLSGRHAASSSDCNGCHVPWSGVSDEMCLGCHTFSNASSLRPEIRFHEAERYCSRCHTEHQGRNGRISIMQHTLLHPDLICSQCHIDPHGQLFGKNCRECHGIRTWTVTGYRHPSQDNVFCYRCHVPPMSHQGDHYREIVLRAHQRGLAVPTEPSPNQCNICHVIYDWRQRLM